MKPETIGLFEAIHSQRAIRQLKPDPVPDELINKILDAAIRAPSGANSQPWSFVVVKDPLIRRCLKDVYFSPVPPAHTINPTPALRRARASYSYFRQHFEEIPVIILCCVRRDGVPNDFALGSYIYPAVQNILLAARSLGLGSALTTRPEEPSKGRIKELLGIPANVELAAILPIGYPLDGVTYGPTNRVPAADVTYYDRWGTDRKPL